MFNHQPPDYNCPFCNLLAGKENEYNQLRDIVYQDDIVTATIAPKWWVNNPGHVLVIPHKHYENIYDIPADVFAEVYKVVKRISIAMRKTYNCDGTSTRQHNEPAGDQDVWHLHVHVYPRYTDDNLYFDHGNVRFAAPEERVPYADKLRAYLATAE